MHRDVIGDALAALREEHGRIGAAIAALEQLRGHDAITGEAAAPEAPSIERQVITKLAAPPAKDIPAAPRGRLQHGGLMKLIRQSVAAHKGPFTCAEITRQVGQSAGKSVLPQSIRNALGLMVNMGEIKIVHEGTSRTDPTTWVGKGQQQ